MTGTTQETSIKRKLKLIDHCPNWERILEQDKDQFTKYIPDTAHPTAEACKIVVTPEILKALDLDATPSPAGAVK